MILQYLGGFSFLIYYLHEIQNMLIFEYIIFNPHEIEIQGCSMKVFTEIF